MLPVHTFSGSSARFLLCYFLPALASAHLSTWLCFPACSANSSFFLHRTASFPAGAGISASPFHQRLLHQSGRKGTLRTRPQAVADVLTEAPLPEPEVRDKVRRLQRALWFHLGFLGVYRKGACWFKRVRSNTPANAFGRHLEIR